MNYEETIKRLREICDKLRDENTTLDETAKLYKEGIGLCDSCKKMLDGYMSALSGGNADE